ncbi:hypothetical protein PUR33_10815 [Streptomyces sp. BE282]|uniref:hypothetical protein n=1 Tax=Streptomyces sp. BE282 TaxID=3002527 RepID=UPI002E7A3A88|nr:hypothetical protein [Streptomyces sp. BE282]MEE1729600.1 hypothetical protein [Streptomyces sp. BE282]
MSEEDRHPPENVVHSNTFHGTEGIPELASDASQKQGRDGEAKRSRAELIQAAAALVTALTGLLALLLTKL